MKKGFFGLFVVTMFLFSVLVSFGDTKVAELQPPNPQNVPVVGEFQAPNPQNVPVLAEFQPPNPKSPILTDSELTAEIKLPDPDTVSVRTV